MTSIFSGSAGSAQSAAHKMMNGFNFGIQTGGNAAVVTTRSITNAINSSFMSAAPQTYNCGYWIGIGLANGMRASLGEVRSVAMQLAEAAETAVIAKAKIGSPAKVFIVLGKYFFLSIESHHKDILSIIIHTKSRKNDCFVVRYREDYK